MEEKINLKAVEQYGEEYALRVLERSFPKSGLITGPEILALCEIRQINLFIISELFNTWKRENNKIRSPYFNYAADEVQEALDNLMSTLSNHISIDRDLFAPLLKKATIQTMMLVVDPYDFFADLIEESETIEVESFRSQLKYIKINKAPLDRLLQKIEEKGVKQLSSNEAFAMLDSILEEVNFTPEDIDDYLNKFSAVLPVTIDRFYETKNITPAPVETPPPVEVKKEVRVTVQETIVQQPKPTVNEKLAQQPRPTVADNFKKIGRIKDSLTINQKFMFTKTLFHGDFELFSKAIDDLDRQDDINGALRYLEQNYEEWDRESEEFHEFMELVEKRFS